MPLDDIASDGDSLGLPASGSRGSLYESDGRSRWRRDVVARAAATLVSSPESSGRLWSLVGFGGAAGRALVTLAKPLGLKRLPGAPVVPTEMGAVEGPGRKQRVRRGVASGAQAPGGATEGRGAVPAGSQN